MNPKILILTASYGDGHNAAARSLEEALNAGVTPVTVRTLDVFAEAQPRLNQWFRFGYRTTITFLPRVWRVLYDIACHHVVFPALHMVDVTYH